MFATTYPRIRSLQGSSFEMAGYSAVTPMYFNLLSRMSWTVFKWQPAAGNVLTLTGDFSLDTLLSSALLSSATSLNRYVRDLGQVLKACKSQAMMYFCFIFS